MLYKVLRFLGQEPPSDLTKGNLDDFWRWAIAHWRVERIPRVPGVVVETPGSFSV